MGVVVVMHMMVKSIRVSREFPSKFVERFVLVPLHPTGNGNELLVYCESLAHPLLLQVKSLSSRTSMSAVTIALHFARPAR